MTQEPIHIRCKCGQPVDITELASASEVTCPVCGEVNTLAPDEAAALNNRINRKIADIADHAHPKDAIKEAVKEVGKTWVGADHRAPPSTAK